MKLDDMFPRRFATGDDLKGKTPTLVIDAVTAEQIRPGPGAQPQTKFVIWFKGAAKGVILSRTLANQIAHILGTPDTDDWTGKKITLVPEPMTVAGTPRIAIRARAAANGETPPPAGLQDEDED